MKPAVAVIIAFLVGVGVVLSAQPNNSERDDAGTIKIDVDLVLVTVTVTDDDRRPVMGLSKDDFHLWEDKLEQDIKYFSSDEVPVTTGIVLDISGSMDRKISSARDAAASVLKSGSPEDEYFLVEFNSHAQLSEDLSTDITRLQNRLAFSPVEGKTALFDAVYLALERIRHARNSRKALVLITDGEDNHSRYSSQNIRDFLREADVQVFAIRIETYLGAFRPAGRSGRVLLEEITKKTGGKVFFPNSADDLESICSEIALELKSQYVLGYASSNTSKDGNWRKVRVKVNPPKGTPALSVRAKAGYYSPTP